MIIKVFVVIKIKQTCIVEIVACYFCQILSGRSYFLSTMHIKKIRIVRSKSLRTIALSDLRLRAFGIL